MVMHVQHNNTQPMLADRDWIQAAWPRCFLGWLACEVSWWNLAAFVEGLLGCLGGEGGVVN
jgi:hypothetical protein